MSLAKHWSVHWAAPQGELSVIEPTAAETAAAAPTLALHYNESHNRAMLAHRAELSVVEVMEHFEALWAEHARPFLLQCGGRLIGDADLRHIRDNHAECAILIGERVTQGRGLGTRFGIMVHALAFGPLGLERVYASIIRSNDRSQRLFRRLGYVPDNSPKARRCADESDDLTFSVDRHLFLQAHAAALKQIQLREREVDTEPPPRSG